ncbi:hypothetical protein LTR56_005358 [Elasticomyces elasticus]|nr:hypothetical protein LTR22_018681 [Elasticomyces elasticus]KAK3651852.1 hypothetical protein LTR56_005358 [Elasticomyces elasticus]KAK4927747.1 hypothetical protein LTR49_005370 [Elasticomyces elasticus]KAK5761419.1 hypothetical protein LTS12_008379 [Elasticomyces elasticus]
MAALTGSLTNTATTTLHLAAPCGNVRAVGLLLQHEADISARDRNGSTPLMIVLNEDNVAVVAALLAHRRTNDLQAGRNLLCDTANDQLGLQKVANPSCVESLCKTLDLFKPILGNSNLDNNVRHRVEAGIAACLEGIKALGDESRKLPEPVSSTVIYDVKNLTD